MLVHLAVAMLIMGVGGGGHWGAVRCESASESEAESGRRVVVEESSDTMPTQLHRSSSEMRASVGLHRVHYLVGLSLLGPSPIRIVRLGRALTSQGRYDLASQPLSFVALRDVTGVLLS